MPPLANLCPLDIKASAKLFELETTALEYSTNSGVLTSKSWAAKAPIW